MVKKSNFIKNLLTTASAVAVLAGSVQSAMAAERTTILNVPAPAVPGSTAAPNRLVSVAADWVTAAPVNNDSVKFGDDNQVITMDGVNTFLSLNTSTKAAPKLIVASNVSLGSIAGTNAVGVTVNNTKELTLTGAAGVGNVVAADTYTGLGPVTLAGATAKLIINRAAGAGLLTFAAGTTIDGGGLMEVNTAATFDGLIGATTKLVDVKITAGVAATFNKSVNATTISMGNAGAIMNIGNAAVNTGVVITGNVVATAGGNGIINFKGSDASVVGNIGAVGTLVDQVNIDNGVSATVAGNIAANTGIKFLGATAHLKLTSGAANTRTITGPVIANAANDGILEFADNGVVAGTIGAAAAINKLIIGAGTVELQGAVTKTNAGIELGNAASILKLSTAGQTITSDIRNTSGTDGKGKIQIANNNHTITGNVGAAGAQLEAMEIADNGSQITFQKAGAVDLYIKDITNTNAAANGGVLKFKADSVNIYGNIGTADKKLTGIDVQQNFAGGGETAVTLKAGSKVYATNFDMTEVAAVNNTLALEDNAELHAAIISTNNSGKVQVKGNATINGIIGGINKILFDTPDKTLTVTKNNIAINAAPGNGIDFAADGTLNLTENAGANINAPLLIGANANGQGAIQVNKAVANKTITLIGAVGDVATVDANTKALKLLEVKGGANVVLTGGDAYIKTIDIGTNEATLTLSKGAGRTYKIGEFKHDDGKGTVEFADDTILKAGTKLSTATSKLKAFKFASDKTVTLEDGIDIYTGANGIQNNARGDGELIFKGTSIVDAIVGQNNQLKAIEIQGDGKSVTFKQKVNLNTANDGTIVIYKGATAVFEGDVVGKSIDAKNTLLTGEGTINFANKAATEVDLKIGEAHVLKTIEFSGADVVFKQDVLAKNLNFTNDGPTTVTFVVDDSAAQLNLTTPNVNTKSDTRQHDIKIVSKDSTVAKGINFRANSDVATEANKFGNFIINDKITLDINTTNFLAGVVTDTAGKGQVNFIKNGGATTLNLGDENVPLESITFTENGAVIGVLNATTITVNPNRTATFKDSIFVSGAMTLGAGSIADFKGDATVAGAITGTAGKGKVLFDSGADITGALSDLQEITFSSNDKAKEVAVKGDLRATNINVAGLTFRPTDAVTLTGASAFTGTTLDLSNSKNVTLTGGNSTLSGNINVIVNLASADQTSLGQIIVDGANGKLDAVGVTGFQVRVNEADNIDLPGVTPRTFTLISTTKGATFTGLTQDKVAGVIGGNKFAEWTFEATTGKLTQKNNAAAKLQEIVGAGDPKLLADAARIGDARNVSDARAFQTDLGKMATPEQVKDALSRLSNPIITAADAVGGAIYGASQMTQNRIGELSPHPIAGIQTSDASGITGVSAGDGDDRTRYGAWVSPFYNVANQSAKSSTPGYKATSYGTTIGVDTMTNADMSLGVALSYLKTDVKHKDIKSGDKTKSDTYMFSVYGIQQLTNSWFLQGVATFSSSKIKNSEKRRVSTGSGYQVAKGEYDATSYGTELLAGYLHSAGEVKVTPLGGIAVSRFNDGGYKETGTTSQNLSITRKAVTKLEGILGARVEMANVYAAEGMELVPELHTYVRHNFLNQSAKVTTKLDGLNQQFTPKSAKANKTMFNLGTSLNSKSGMYEYGAGYDLNLSNKYVGHQGTVKVRVNF